MRLIAAWVAQRRHRENEKLKVEVGKLACMADFTTKALIATYGSPAFERFAADEAAKAKERIARFNARPQYGWAHPHSFLSRAQKKRKRGQSPPPNLRTFVRFLRFECRK